MGDYNKMRSWAEISFSALEHNINEIRSLISPDCKILVPVKADAYGHGAVAVSKKLEQLGVDMLGVACLSEAAELREGGITKPILSLGYNDPEFADVIIDNNVTQTVFDLETAEALSKAAEARGKKITVHIKLDTGMTRIGFQWTEKTKEKSIETIKSIYALPGLYVEGLFSHFAAADGDAKYTEMQIARMKDAIETLKNNGVTFDICHCAASSGTLYFPQAHFDMVRPGLAIYGYAPDGIEKGMRPIMTLKSRIAAVRKVQKGTCVSYGCTATLERDSVLASVMFGYADGFDRELSNRYKVVINGHRCPVVGRICMDMCMVDITDYPDIKRGDEVVIYGEEGLIIEQSKMINSIPNELLTRIAKRVTRVYTED